MRATQALLGLLWLCGCGTQAKQVRPLKTAPQVRASSTGVDVAVLARPTGDMLLLSLYVDAGARDGAVPQVAAIAARLAAEAGGEAMRGVAHPDATELSLPCERAKLRGCLRALARALSSRDPTPAQVSEALAAQAAGRRRALAADRSAAAALGLRALFGDDAAKRFIPLGDPRDDASVTPAAVGAFLADHFGEERTLVIAAGDVEAGTLRRSAAEAFAGKTRARTDRQARGLPEVLGSRTLKVGIARSPSVGMVALSTSPAEGANVAALLREELGGTGEVTAQVTPVRGGALTWISLPGRDPRGLADLAAWLPLPAPHSAEPAAPLDDVWASSRALGLDWATRGPAAPREVAFGIGVLLQEAPRAGDDGSDRAAAAQAKLLERLRLPALSAANGADDGGDAVQDTRVSVTLSNGVRVEIATEAGDAAGLALRFAGGAAHDPPTAHGRAAVLAHLAAQHCDGRSSDAHAARLRALGAVLTPSVDAAGWGLQMQVPADKLEAGLRLLVRCALRPSRAPAHLHDATAAVHDQLAADSRDSRMRAAVARALSPRSPGRIAPLGSAQGLASLGIRSLTTAVEQDLVGRRLSIAVVGPRPAPAVLELLSRRLASLRAGTHASAPADSTPSPPDEAPLAGETSEQVLLWHARNADCGAAGQAVADLAGRRLATAGVEPLWQAGGANWAAVGVTADMDGQEPIAARAETAMSSLGHEVLVEAVARHFAADSLRPARSLGAGGAADRAQRMLLGAAGDRRMDLERCVQAAQAVSQTRPRAVPVR